jgi:DNA polymerase III delta subunit
VIELLTGENDFELTKKVAQLKADFDGRAERYDGADLTLEKLVDIFAGQTIFALKRLVVIDTPSASADLWQNISVWSDRLSDDTRLVLVEPKLDKRTSTYKWLNKHAAVQQFDIIDDRDTATITKWVEGYAKRSNVGLTSHQARRIAGRAGADQWAIAHAVDKLALLPAITDEWIDDVLEPKTTESVFALFETALSGDTKRLSAMLDVLHRDEEPYRIFGLISSQVLQLAALVFGDGNVSRVASDTAAKSSYPFQKLAPYANRLNKRQAGEMVRMLAEGDKRLKSSDADPWVVLESSLIQVATLVTK